MDKHTSYEQAYKNGYQKGYEDGQPKWISVKDRLPDTTCLNLALIGELPFLAYYDGKNWRSSGTLRVLAIDHWMPLPEAPKGE